MTASARLACSYDRPSKGEGENGDPGKWKRWHGLSKWPQKECQECQISNLSNQAQKSQQSLQQKHSWQHSWTCRRGGPASGVTGTTQPAATRQTRRPPRRSPQRKDRPRAAISHDHTLAGTSLLTRGSVPPRATVQAVWPRSRHPRQLCWFFLR